MLAIGIDLGTTNSCVTVFQHGNVEIIVNDQGNRTTPSYVAFTDTERLIGDSAKAQSSFNPENTVFRVKSLIGRKYDDPTIAAAGREHWPFQLYDSNGSPKIKITYQSDEKLFNPEEISAMVLRKMKETAEIYLGQKVTNAVITVPAYFNDSQRQATKDAGAIAGLNVLRIINEPTAPALAYGLDKNLKGRRNVLIFDLGGGTLDVSILTIDEGSLFEVKATSGDTSLGGEDLDIRMANYIQEEFNTYFPCFLFNSCFLRRLRANCEQAKSTLSSSSKVRIEVDPLRPFSVRYLPEKDFHYNITRAEFEYLCRNLFRNILEPVKRALQYAQMDKGEIDDVVLVGGSTRMPMIQKMLREFFNGKELCRSINPDEAVAYGAAIQAAILAGDKSEKIRDILVADVTPLSLGIDAAGGMMAKIVERNSRIPCKTSKVFSTFFDNQPKVTIQVFEGERAMTKDNHLLGKFDIFDIPPAPRGVPQIEVTFNVDANGILHLSAEDKSSGKSQSIRITNDKGRLSKEEIDRMLEEAESYAEEDELQRERVSALNDLESFVYSAKHAAAEASDDQLSTSEKEEVNETCEEVIRWLDGNPHAEKVEVDYKMRETQSQLSPIMTKIRRPNASPSDATSTAKLDLLLK